MPYEFHNPYNFVGTPDRGNVLESSFAGDHDPSSPDQREDHSRYWEERYTGVIPVRLRTQTPLFITNPETSYEMTEGTGHCVYDCMEEIPPTALKGMLSSAYEVVTNSRYRVFSEKQHKKRLGYRYPAQATLVPGMVVDNDGQLSVTLFTGTSNITPNGASNELYAAWLPTYSRTGSTEEDKACEHLMHGQEYKDVHLRLYSHGSFKFWSVEKINGITLNPITKKAEPINETKTVSGYVVKSGRIFNKKHDERFFFNDGERPVISLPIDNEVREAYERLLEDYQNTHKIAKGRQLNPPGSGSVHGAHITDKERLKLTPETFIYVKTNGRAIQAIYPVQISRDLSDKSPWDCLEDSLKPAEKVEKEEHTDRLHMPQLSPADRLFGWVRQKGKGAWKGKVRIICEPYDKEKNGNLEPVEKFRKPLPLSILGAPKPAQARFYLGDAEGKSQRQAIAKQDATYKDSKKLRGRKVYLHHSLGYLKSKEEKERYWDVTSEVDREYSRFSEDAQGQSSQQSNQNRSITGWIPKRRDFSFKLRFENLTEEELGALLALLDMCEDSCYFRLGFGKPLGFGSVRLSIPWEDLGNKMPIAKGKDMADRYKTLGEPEAFELTKDEARRLIQVYQKAMVQAYGGNQDADQSTEPDLYPWESLEFAQGLLDEEKEAFRNAWREALKSGHDVPLEALDGREIYLEEFPDLDDVLSKMYKDTLKAYQDFAKQDFGWGKLSFIKEFKASMKGFAEPVAYPRKSASNMEEGFAWFVENDRRENNRYVNGYSLPEIGKTLTGF